MLTRTAIRPGGNVGLMLVGASGSRLRSLSATSSRKGSEFE
jgi:hypothetical protein